MMKRAKAIVAAAGGLCILAAPMLADDLLNVGEVGQLLAGVIAAGAAVYGVWRVPNRPQS